MKKRSTLLSWMICSALIASATPSAWAQQSDTEKDGRWPQKGWSTMARGGAVYQFDTDMDKGGSFDASRFNIEIGRGYTWDPQTALGLSFSYSYDGYSFSGGQGLDFAARNPWENINTFSLSAPMRRAINKEWTGFFIPSVRSTGESGADFNDTITGGVLAGVSYRFGERLTIGPGIGVFSQLEDSATVIPILLIDWKITETLSLETGRGLAATLGPGLTLKYQPSSIWTFMVGGRMEELRFRLDKDGIDQGGIGEDSSYPVFMACTYNVSPKVSTSLVGGVEFGGEMRLEDQNGNLIVKESYDPGVYLGLTFNASF